MLPVLLLVVSVTSFAGSAGTNAQLRSELARVGFQPAAAFNAAVQPGDVLDRRSGALLLTAADCLDVSAEPREGDPVDLGVSGSRVISVDLDALQAYGASVESSSSYVAFYEALRRTEVPTAALRPTSGCVPELRQLARERRRRGQAIDPMFVAATLRGAVDVRKESDVAASGSGSYNGVTLEAGLANTKGSVFQAENTLVGYRLEAVRGYGYVQRGLLLEASAGTFSDIGVAIAWDSVLRRIGLSFGAGVGVMQNWYGWDSDTGEGGAWITYTPGVAAATLVASVGPIRGGVLQQLELEASVGAFGVCSDVLPCFEHTFPGYGGALRWGPPGSRFWGRAGLERVANFSIEYTRAGDAYYTPLVPTASVGGSFELRRRE